MQHSYRNQHQCWYQHRCRSVGISIGCSWKLGSSINQVPADLLMPHGFRSLSNSLEILARWTYILSWVEIHCDLFELSHGKQNQSVANLGLDELWPDFLVSSAKKDKMQAQSRNKNKTNNWLDFSLGTWLSGGTAVRGMAVKGHGCPGTEILSAPTTYRTPGTRAPQPSWCSSVPRWLPDLR